VFCTLGAACTLLAYLGQTRCWSSTAFLTLGSAPPSVASDDDVGATHLERVEQLLNRAEAEVNMGAYWSQNFGCFAGMIIERYMCSRWAYDSRALE
jgi:hypothetical protein